MTPLQQLSIVEELANNRAEPWEFKNPLIAVREALLACEELHKEHLALKASKAKVDSELRDLALKHLKFVDSQKEPPPDTNWLPGPGLKH